jgi:hypothetical protein
MADVLRIGQYNGDLKTTRTPRDLSGATLKAMKPIQHTFVPYESQQLDIRLRDRLSRTHQIDGTRRSLDQRIHLVGNAHFPIA